MGILVRSLPSVDLSAPSVLTICLSSRRALSSRSCPSHLPPPASLFWPPCCISCPTSSERRPREKRSTPKTPREALDPRAPPPRSGFSQQPLKSTLVTAQRATLKCTCPQRDELGVNRMLAPAIPAFCTPADRLRRNCIAASGHASRGQKWLKGFGTVPDFTRGSVARRLRRIPPKMVVIGGSYIGLRFWSLTWTNWANA